MRRRLRGRERWINFLEEACSQSLLFLLFWTKILVSLLLLVVVFSLLLLSLLEIIFPFC
ncbi:hypothetical protein Sjap_006629 [Stephania japonica]|uniref:Uncharacterized protein n=1 Tax=Stephania japonica TaxID=461633 RepID=A0AAP0PN00_9MAGN